MKSLVLVFALTLFLLPCHAAQDIEAIEFKDGSLLVRFAVQYLPIMMDFFAAKSEEARNDIERSTSTSFLFMSLSYLLILTSDYWSNWRTPNEGILISASFCLFLTLLPFISMQLVSEKKFTSGLVKEMRIKTNGFLNICP